MNRHPLQIPADYIYIQYNRNAPGYVDWFKPPNDSSIKFYKDFISGLYYRDSAGIVRKANTLELSNLNKENHNQKWADSVYRASPPVFKDTIFCDRAYYNEQAWTTTNNKVAPVPLKLRVVKWLRGVQYPDGIKYFDNTGTHLDFIWCRLKTSLIWIPLKGYQ